MIQQSVNQLLGTAAIGLRASPIYQRKTEAKEIAGKAESAMSGLKAIQQGLSEPGKSLSQTELNDIKARTAELNRNVYDAKIRSHEGDVLAEYLSGPVSKLPHQAEYTKVLQDIESNINKRQMAMDRMRELAESKIQQDDEFKNFKKSITGGEDGRT